MHISDNYLSPSTCLVLTAAMVPIWAISVKKVKEEISKEKIPLLGMGASFSFLIMMFNIPLPGGTTGHAVGGVLLAILLGPYAASISVTVALLIQALLFGDGGILAFGANVFNLAFLMPFAGFAIYRWVKGRLPGEKWEAFGIAIGSYFGLNIAALVASIELGIQPLLYTNSAGQALYSPYPLTVAIPAMLIPHLLVAGVVEAIFTLGVLAFIKKVSPGTLYDGAQQKPNALYGLIITLMALTPLGLLATGVAWGEWETEEIQHVVSDGVALGYIPEGMRNGFQFQSMMPDYTILGLPEPAGYVLSAVAGTALLVILFKVFYALKRRQAGKLSR